MHHALAAPLLNPLQPAGEPPTRSASRPCPPSCLAQAELRYHCGMSGVLLSARCSAFASRALPRAARALPVLLWPAPHSVTAVQRRPLGSLAASAPRSSAPSIAPFCRATSTMEAATEAAANPLLTVGREGGAAGRAVVCARSRRQRRRRCRPRLRRTRPSRRTAVCARSMSCLASARCWHSCTPRLMGWSKRLSRRGVAWWSPWSASWTACRARGAR